MKGIFSPVLAIVFLVIKIFLCLVIAIFLFQTLRSMFKNRWKGKHSLKRKWQHKLWHLRDMRYWSPIEFVKWVLIDIIRGKDRMRLFGIWCFTGYFGEGKTLGAVTYAKRMQQLDEDIHIYTNFNMVGQHGKITCWEDLLNLPPKTIVIFDEIQSTFTSQKYKDFPIELLWKLTQCRKTGLCVFASSPVFHRMSIQLRENTDMVIECNNVLSLDRWFNYRFYRAPEYEMYRENPIKLFQSRVRAWSFIAQDRDYRTYNTSEIVDRLDIDGSNDKQKKIKSNDYNKLKNEILKLVDEKIRKIA